MSNKRSKVIKRKRAEISLTADGVTTTFVVTVSGPANRVDYAVMSPREVLGSALQAITAQAMR